MFVIVPCSLVPIRLNMDPLIHAATTTLTATVTAMRMMDATTGLRAFEFLFSFRYILFIWFSLYGFMVCCLVCTDLNIVTQYIILSVCTTTLQQNKKKQKTRK